MIYGYTLLNDRLFGKMAHPSYQYGKDGYVFGSGLTYIKYDEYHEVFADMVKQLQEYCKDRDVPFLMVFNPAKPAVTTEYLPEGIYYNRQWVDQFMQALEERNINYLDNTLTLKEKHLAGESVFNKKYDAGHWNDLGAYYGVTAAANILQKEIATVHITGKNELTISQKLETTLPVSKFPIEEYVPSISIDMSYSALAGNYVNELELHKSYRGFGYYVNSELKAQGAPKALVFQGSYMNTYGLKYLINTFGEYIHVHDYQNVLNFDYYFNIFQPECVIFEVAEYTINDSYFSYDVMKNMSLNHPLSIIKEQVSLTEKSSLDKNSLFIKNGEALTTVTWNTNQSFKYVWLEGTREYDFRKCENGYEVTVQTSDYQATENEFQIVAFDNEANKLIYFTIA